MESPKQLKDKGNVFFSSKNYTQAIECYSQAIEELIAYKIQDNLFLSVVYCNRSACYIYLNDFQNSEVDARKCLYLDPSNFKAKFRLGVSFIEQNKKHDEALLIFEELSKVEEYAKLLGKQLIDIECKTRVMISQQKGQYNIMEIPFEPSLQESEHLQEYFGNIYIKSCELKDKGRGIFLSKDVVAGELILVEKVFAFVTDDGKSMSIPEDEKVIRNEKLKSKLKTNIKSLIKDDINKVKMSYLYCSQPKDGELKIPDISIYYASYNDNRSNLNTNHSMFTEEDYDQYLDDVIKFNTFDFEFVINPDNSVRESIIKTLNFLTSDYGSNRKDVQIPKPCTKLQKLLLYYDNISKELSGSVEGASSNETAIVDKTSYEVYIEGTGSTFRFYKKSNDKDYNKSRNLGSTPSVNMNENIVTDILTELRSNVDISFEDLCEQIVTESIRLNEVNSSDILGCTPLHYAVMTSNLPLTIKLLQIPDIDVNKQDKLGFTALHYASGQYFHKDILTLLGTHSRININLVTYQYLTPLYLAATSYNIKAMFILLKAGANPLIGHPYSLFTPSPLMYALENDYKQHLKMYEVAGYMVSKLGNLITYNKKGLGLFLVTSFFNHANSETDVNTVRLFIGQYIFVYADQNMKAGTELLISYSKNLESLNSNWGIQE